VTPEERLGELVELLHAADEPDFDLIGEVGCGELENLVRAHGEQLWPVLERLARADPIFRRALRSVWAYDSPEFERRDKLLRELGEHWPVTVRFEVEPQDFEAEPLVSWRAVEVDGAPPAGQLGRVLREVADWYEREGDGHGGRYVDAKREVWTAYYEWSQATWTLDRATHRLGIAHDHKMFVHALRAVEAARASERERWERFVAVATEELLGGA
jgi:hypothetical protein